MMPVEDLLYDYALGALDEADTRRVAQSLATSTALRGELTAIEELLAGVAADLPAVAPAEEARARLMTVAETQERWTPFLKRMAALVDLAEAQMRAVFAKALDLANWEPGPVPGVQLFHFDGGPRLAAVDAGLARLPKGATSPVHRHIGDELVFVLEGSFVDLVSGQVHKPGDLIHHGPGSEHAFRVVGDSDLVYALLVNAEIQIVGPPPA